MDITDTYSLAEHTGARSRRLTHNPSQDRPADNWTLSYTLAVIDANNRNPGQPELDADGFPGTGNRHTIRTAIAYAVNGNPGSPLTMTMASTTNTRTERFDLMSGATKVAELLAVMTRRQNDILAEFTLENFVGVTGFTFDVSATFPVVRSVPATPATTRLVDLGAIHGTSPAGFALVDDGTYKLFYRVNQQVGEHDTGLTGLTGTTVLQAFDKAARWIDYHFALRTRDEQDDVIRTVLAGNVDDDWLGFRTVLNDEHQFLTSNVEVRAPNIGGMAATPVWSQVYFRSHQVSRASTLYPTLYTVPEAGILYFAINRRVNSVNSRYYFCGTLPARALLGIGRLTDDTPSLSIGAVGTLELGQGGQTGSVWLAVSQNRTLYVGFSSTNIDGNLQILHQA